MKTPGKVVKSNRKVAIKKIKMQGFRDGIDASALREIKYLQELKHGNVIEVSIFSYISL